MEKRIKTGYNTGLAKVAVQCCADTFVFIKVWFSASKFVVKNRHLLQTLNVMCNLMTKATLTILTILTLGFTTPKKETIFIGTVTTDNKNKDNNFGLYIEFRVDTLVIARNIIQQDGTFKVSATADKEFDIYYRGIGVGDTYVQTIKPTDKDTVSLTFKVPKDYKKYFAKTVCPKCNKHDQTIPIRYGLGSAIVIQHVDSKGDTTLTPYDNKNYYNGGCVTSDIDPKYFCKRDKIKF